jgi:hypothetical protein
LPPTRARSAHKQSAPALLDIDDDGRGQRHGRRATVARKRHDRREGNLDAGLDVRCVTGEVDRIVRQDHLRVDHEQAHQLVVEGDELTQEGVALHVEEPEAGVGAKAVEPAGDLDGPHVLLRHGLGAERRRRGDVALLDAVADLAPVNGHAARRANAHPDLAAGHVHDGDVDVISNHDSFSWFAGEREHSLALPRGTCRVREGTRHAPHLMD